jgi:hypothetical protein
MVFLPQIEYDTFPQQRIKQMIKKTGHPGLFHHVPDQESMIEVD